MIRRVLLASASTLLVLIVAEMASRAVERSPEDAVRVVEWREYEPDEVLGWVPRAGGEHVVKRGDLEIRERSNSLRLLGPEIARAKPVGTFRVLVLGDSIVEGLEALRDQRLTTQLEARLRSEGRTAEVLNAGRTGYQTDQEVLFYGSDGRTMNADLVVLVVYLGNDIVGNGLSENEFATTILPKPRFRLEGDALILASVPGRGAASDGRPLARSAIEDIKAWMAERSALYRAARAAWAQVLVLTAPRRVPPVWEVFRLVATPEVEEAWALTSALVARLRDDVEGAGARLLVVVVPDERQVSEAKWQEFLAFYRLRPSQWDQDGADRRFAGVCADRRLECLDMLEALRSAPSEPYLPRGGHLDRAGHAVVSEALFEWISTRMPSVR